MARAFSQRHALAFGASLAAIATLGVALTASAASQAADPTMLVLEGKVPLGAVRGRIDHLAVDLPRQRLFVAELGNNSLGVVDLGGHKLLRSITGLSEPQGVAYVAAGDQIWVANAKDGSVRIFSGEDLAPVGRIDLGDDADNVRFDAKAAQVLVGYGSGAIAILDPRRQTKIGAISLKAHPESFQIDPGSERIFANVPNAEQIAVLDRNAGKQIATWPIRSGRANFPMTIDVRNGRVLVMTRQPPRLVAYDQKDGAVLGSVPACGDADDLFVDDKRQRIYVSCGEGVIDVFEMRGGSYERLARIPTVFGARTALFVPELDRLFLAVRARDREPAAIWIFRPES